MPDEIKAICPICGRDRAQREPHRPTCPMIGTVHDGGGNLTEIKPQLTWNDEEICVSWMGPNERHTHLIIDLSSGAVSWASKDGEKWSGQDDCVVLSEQFLKALAVTRACSFDEDIL